LKDLCVDGRILLKWMITNNDMRLWTGLAGVRIGPSGELLSTR